MYQAEEEVVVYQRKNKLLQTRRNIAYAAAFGGGGAGAALPRSEPAPSLEDKFVILLATAAYSGACPPSGSAVGAGLLVGADGDSISAGGEGGGEGGSCDGADGMKGGKGAGGRGLLRP